MNNETSKIKAILPTLSPDVGWFAPLREGSPFLLSGASFIEFESPQD